MSEMSLDAGRFVASSADVRSVRRSPLALALAGTGGGLAVLAAVAGVLSWPDAVSVMSARGQAVQLFGSGVYQFDSLFTGAANRGTDLITLLLVLPALALALVGWWRGSLRSAMVLTGALTWLVYVYGTRSVGAAFSSWFLLDVAVFAAAGWALVLTVSGIDVGAVQRLVPRLPGRWPAALLLISGAVTALIWLIPMVTALMAGDLPERLDGYTTAVTVAVDVAVVAPAAVAAGLGIRRGRASGYLLAVPLLVLAALLAPMIAAQTVSQLTAGITLTAAEIIGPVAGFVVLSAAAAVVLWSVLRAVPARVRVVECAAVPAPAVTIGELAEPAGPPAGSSRRGAAGDTVLSAESGRRGTSDVRR